MNNTRREFLHVVSMLGGAVVAGCGGESGTDAGRMDTGGGRTDTGGGGTDTGGGGTDTGGGGTDTGGGGTDTGGGGTDTGSGGCATPTATIGTNHGHALTVSAADVTAGTERTYMIMGTSPHAHSVTITAADFATLATGASIMVTSTRSTTHSHVVTVSCA